MVHVFLWFSVVQRLIQLIITYYLLKMMAHASDWFTVVQTHYPIIMNLRLIQLIIPVKMSCMVVRIQQHLITMQ